MRPIAWWSLLVLILTDDVGGVGPWCHHYYPSATPTPGLLSRGLSVARHVVVLVDGLRTQA
jgi:hypothetical protein